MSAPELLKGVLETGSRVALAVSPHFYEKQNRAPARDGSNLYAMGHGWQAAQMTARAIVRHTAEGRALCVAALKGEHRHTSQFVSAQLMGLDFDQNVSVVQAMNYNALSIGYAFYVYPTASSTAEAPRTRMLFMLDQPILDSAAYTRLLKRLLHAFAGLTPDGAAKDCVRLFYGSVQPGKYWATVLPLAELEALAPHPDELRAQPVEARPAVELRRDYGAYVQATVERVLAVVSGAREGGRNETLNRAAFRLGQLVGSDWAGVSRSDAEAMLLSAAPINGDFTRHEAERTIRSGLDAGCAEPQPAPAGVERLARPTAALAVIEAAAPLAVPPADFTVSARTLAATYEETLNRADRMPLPFPLTCLHALGGFCAAVVPGKLIGVVGISGGMKTSFAETLTDTWRQHEPADVIWWGPEWTPEEMLNRAIQRYGTVEKPTAGYQDVVLHQRWQAEVAANVEPARRRGKKLADATYTNSVAVAKWVAKWPGDALYVRQMDIALDALLASMTAVLDEQRAIGRAVRVVVFDYVQLLQLRDVRSELERIEQALGLIKAFCADRALIGIVNSQVTKTQASSVREGEGVLEVEAGQFLRSDKFNLILTLNPHFTAGLLSTRGTINVAKNSTGKTGKVTVRIDPARLRWLDEAIGEEPHAR